MSRDVLVVVEQLEGELSDVTFELLGKAQALAAALGGKVHAALCGSGVEGLAPRLGAADVVLLADDAVLAHFSPEAWVATLAPVVRDRAPALVLVGNTGMGMDVAAGIAAGAELPLAAYAVDVTAEGGEVRVTSQLYGGKLLEESTLAGGRGVVTVLAGAWPADAGRVNGAPAVERIAAVAPGHVRFRRLILPEASDVDITREATLVSVGRGIGEEGNIELAEELAQALGGAVSASRPVVDAGWLPRARQVGKSGLKVKPRLYIAVGISGAPEHLEGMRDAECIVAINSDETAPIFETAHYGVVADLFDVLPALTERLAAGAAG